MTGAEPLISDDMSLPCVSSAEIRVDSLVVGTRAPAVSKCWEVYTNIDVSFTGFFLPARYVQKFRI